MADKNIDLGKLWEEQGWSFKGTGDKKRGEWGFCLGSGDGAFCFESQHRPSAPPLFIEAKSVFYLPNGELCLWGFQWEVDTLSAKFLGDWMGRYKRLLPKQVPTSSRPAGETRESMNKRLFKENLSNQIKIETVQMAINLGLLRR